jgi:hypothetical protein
MLLEKETIIPSELLEEMQRVEVSVDASLTDLRRLHKANRRSMIDTANMSNSLNFTDSISTKDVLDETLSISDASKLIVDDYTVDSSWTKDDFIESRRMNSHHDKSFKEIGLAASFQGSNISFVKINLAPKIGGPWKKKQILDRRKKAASILKLQNQAPASPSLLVEASNTNNNNTTTTFQPAELSKIETNEDDPELSRDPAHIKEISLLTTKIMKKITILKRSTKMLNEFQIGMSPQISPTKDNDNLDSSGFVEFNPDSSAFDSSLAIVEEKIEGSNLRKSFQSAVNDDDSSSTFSASNVKLPTLSRSWSQNLKNKMN